MSIRFVEDESRFILTTANSEYQIRIDPIGILLHGYYGAPVGGFDMSSQIYPMDRGFSANPNEYRCMRPLSLDTLPQEIAGAGVGDMRVSGIALCCANGSRSCDLRYQSHRILPGKYTLPGLPSLRGSNGDLAAQEDSETLEITLFDPVIGLEAKLLYGVIEKKDVITRTVIYTNRGEGSLQLEKACSVCMDFPRGSFDLIHFYGRHAMERTPERLKVGHDIAVVGSKRGHSGHMENPFVILCDRDATETSGDAYGFMLVYSGNHKTEVEQNQTGSTRLVMGIGEENFGWHLGSGESFAAPEVILSYSARGMGGLSRNYHRIIRENIVEAKYYHMRRPVLVNNWEATYFNFNKDKLFAIADAAAQIGIEMFVLDDGWFGVRNDDNSGLGDWFVNTDKLEGGMQAVAEGINARGMKFGLWFEPEMVNEDSDLFRAHPDWALTDPGRKPAMSRNQMVLDMSRQDVQDYLFTSMEAVLASANINYVKWDFNRSVTNLYSHALAADRQKELSHRFVLGTYALLDRLLKRFPELMIEGCSGGGGRFDAGMLYYCPQIWCSDNTDPIARLSIQAGTSYGYPVSTMGSHVSVSPNHQTGRTTSLKTRGIVAMSGTFGYELDLSKLSPQELDIMKQQILDFHRYYRLIQQGNYFRLTKEEAPYCAWEFAAEDQSEALVSIVMKNVEGNPSIPYAKLGGLDSKAVYLLEGSDLEYTGAALMQGGFAFGDLFYNVNPIAEPDSYPARQYHFIKK